MATINSILADIATLSKADIDTLKNHFAKMFLKSATTLEEMVIDNRFSGGMACPVCGCIHIVRNGHRKDGTQRYVCRDCGKSFVATTNTIAMYTKKDVETWETYIDCMINGFALRKTADICDISLNTAFYWRHKILGALQNMADSVILNGIIEADETFFPVSYKGDHKNSKIFVMPRPAHKRGNDNHVRGVSQEQLCVPCAVNRNGSSIAKAATLGRVSTNDLHTIYDGRFDTNSVLVTDKHNSYRRFANSNGMQLVQIKGGKAKKGIYNIQHINNYHSQLKKFIAKFDGISSKHLNNYLIWHNFVNYAPESDVDKRSILLKFVLTQNMMFHAVDISKKPPIPLAA